LLQLDAGSKITALLQLAHTLKMHTASFVDEPQVSSNQHTVEGNIAPRTALRKAHYTAHTQVL
jgi:hypothetical protein